MLIFRFLGVEVFILGCDKNGYIVLFFFYFGGGGVVFVYIYVVYNV